MQSLASNYVVISGLFNSLGTVLRLMLCYMKYLLNIYAMKQKNLSLRLREYIH